MKKALLACLVIVCATALGPRLARAADYYVHPTGDDGAGDGTVAQPWATIDHAVDTIPAAGGDTIWGG